jgi:hypothetical protein
MRDFLYYTSAAIIIGAMLVVLTEEPKRHESCVEKLNKKKSNSEYTVIIDSVYTTNPEYKITQEDIDDAILEMMEDAKYNEN